MNDTTPKITDDELDLIIAESRYFKSGQSYGKVNADGTFDL